jgi:D-alanyl-D-alanine-carboxypeptidase/D-alanyl-D-alanine-endopeptidase
MSLRWLRLAAVFMTACAAPPPVARAPEAAPPPKVPAPKPEVDTVELPRASERHRAEVESLVLPLIEGEWTRSLVVGLLHGETEVYGFGREHDGETRVPDGDTLYQIGSVTKVFTALLLAREVEDGTLRPDDPLQKLLPKSVRVPEKDGHPITLIQLATHTSGLPRVPSNMTRAHPDDPYVDYDSKLLYAFLTGHTLEKTPGSVQAYSNLGAGTLGHALGLWRKQSYEQAVTERITRPLGMAHTRIALGELAERLADGHDDEGKPVPPWHLDALAGAGAIHSSAFDMLRFLKANIAPAPTSLGRALARSHVMQFEKDGDQQTAYGWFIGKRGFWHNGQTAGHHCIVIWNAEKKLGVVVLADSGMIFDLLGLQLMRMLTGETPKLDLPKVVEVTPDKLDRLIGTYTLDEKTEVNVVREGDLFYTQLTGQQRFRLFPESDTEFRLRAVEARVVFELERGKATALVIHQNGRETRAKRKKP